MRTWRAVITILLLSVVSPAGARDIEPTAAAFLDIDANARSVAMGGTGWASTRGLQAAYSNPAGLSHLTLQRAGLMHAQWFEGLTLEWAGYGVGVGEGTGAAVAATFLRSGSVDRFDAFGNPEGTFHVYDAALGASLGHRLTNELRAGLTAKLVHQSVDDVSATGVAADLGATYDARFATLGFVATNLGPDVTIEGEKFPLPTALALGVSVPLLEERLTINAGGNYPLHYYEDVRLGVEVRPVEDLALRVGYRYVIEPGESDQLTALTYGVGVWASSFRFDYAFQPFDQLGDTHRIGLTAVFGGSGGEGAPSPSAQRPPDTAPPPPARSGPPAEERAAVEKAPDAKPPVVVEEEIVASSWAVVAGTHRSRISALQELRALRITGLEGGSLQKLADGQYRLVVAEFDSREEAEDWIDGPGAKHGKLSFSVVPFE